MLRFTARAIQSLPPKLFLSSGPLPSYLPGTSAGARLLKTSADPKQQGNPDISMDKQTQKPNQKAGDVMSQSFGEGYATRSDEEGFGGIYSQSLPDDGKTNSTHTDFDESQGCEVKEKEKGRHQKNGDA